MMSGIQLGYTGVSMVYFVSMVKKVFKKILNRLLPVLKRYGETIHPRKMSLKLFHIIRNLFEIKGIKDGVIKGLVWFFVFVVIKLYCSLQIQKVKLKKKLLEKKISIMRTSEEFWQEPANNFN